MSCLNELDMSEYYAIFKRECAVAVSYAADRSALLLEDGVILRCIEVIAPLARPWLRPGRPEILLSIIISSLRLIDLNMISGRPSPSRGRARGAGTSTRPSITPSSSGSAPRSATTISSAASTTKRTLGTELLTWNWSGD